MPRSIRAGQSMTICLVSAVCAACMVPGIVLSQQPPAPQPRFDVASVKPSPAPATHFAFRLDEHGVDFGNIPLETIVETAFGIDSYQVKAPGWFLDARYDILAQAPPGATRAQVAEMLRALLADRFQMKSHTEDRPSTVYALLVGKGGPTMKVASEDPAKVDIGARQVLQRLVSASGPQFILREPGRMTFESNRITMAELARVLMFYVDVPVVDRTQLKGTWEVQLEVPGGTNYKNRPSAATVGPAQVSDPVGEVSVVASVRKLGLALERQKAPVSTLVVDSMNRSPTEN